MDWAHSEKNSFTKGHAANFALNVLTIFFSVWEGYEGKGACLQLFH